MNLTSINKAVSKVCPIHGMLSATEPDFKPEATPQQRAAAQAIVDGWDWSAEAEAAREEAANPERTAVRRALAAIEADAVAWEAIKDTATAAQTRAAFTKLVGHVVKVARYVGKI
jgi:hypothetical protein